MCHASCLLCQNYCMAAIIRSDGYAVDQIVVHNVLEASCVPPAVLATHCWLILLLVKQ